MNGPKVVCAGCGIEIRVGPPLCPECAARWRGELPEVRCSLCDEGLPTDKHGYYHLTKTGGYAGKCTAHTSTPEQT